MPQFTTIVLLPPNFQILGQGKNKTFDHLHSQ
jgi:hypothetical protein